MKISKKSAVCLAFILYAMGAPSNAAETVMYQYDALGRLIESRVSGGINDGAIRETGWDQASNRTVYSLSNLPARGLLNVADTQADEGATLSFVITRSGNTTGTTKVQYATAAGTATSGTDFTPASGSVSFAPGETTKSVNVATLSDTVAEGSETFNLVLSSPTGGIVQQGSAIGTINNIALGSLSVTNAQASEGTQLAFMITRSGNITGTTTVQYATTTGTATSGTDFTPASGSVSFAPGETMKTVNVSTIYDTEAEGSETFNLVLSSPTGGIVQQGSAVGTIANVAPSFLSATDATATEGGSLAFVITRSGNTTGRTMVQYALAGGSATSDTDFTPASGMLTFQPGETTKTVSVATLSDTVFEESETFNLVLSNPANGIIQQGTAVGTINNVALGSLSVANAQASEGAQLSFVITRSGDTTGTTTVQYATTDGTAISGTDFTSASGSVSFAPGETSKTVSVVTLSDTVAEGSESFNLVLSNPAGGIVQQGSAIGTINNIALGSLSVANAQASEGAPLAFVITRSGDTTGTATVQYATAAGTATSGADFTPASGSVSFAPGETTKTVNVATLSDAVIERPEGITFKLSGAVGALVQQAEAMGSIIDLQPAILEQVGGSLGSENFIGNSRQLRVTRSGDLTIPVTLKYTTRDGTALAGSDYTASSGTLSFAAGQTQVDFSISITADSIVEPDEVFYVDYSDISPGAILRLQGANEVVLWNDDSEISISDAVATEGGSLSFVVTRTGAINYGWAFVNYVTQNGTAIDGTDYVRTSNGFVIEAGQSSATISIPTINDSWAESPETMTVTLSGPSSNATITRATATGTINDDGDTQLPSYFNVSAAQANEGAPINFVITRTGAVTVAATVQYATAEGTARLNDFTPASGSVSFAAGETTKTVSVATLSDTVAEGSETFNLVLSSPTGGIIQQGSAIGTINNVAPSTLSVADAQANEGASLAFVITRSGDTTVTTTVGYSTLGVGQTSGVTAMAGYEKWDETDWRDFNDTNGSVTFAPGETTKTVNVAAFLDGVDEGAETFEFMIDGGDRFIVQRPRAIGTIINIPTSRLYVDYTLANEGAPLNFRISRLGNATGTATVQYATVAGTATSGTDFTPASGSLTFASGESFKTVSVATLSDTVNEGTETISLVLSNPTGAIIMKGSDDGGIVNVAPSSLSLADAQASEGSQLAFVITRSGDTRGATTVQYATAAGTATSGTDFTPASGSVSFAAGETTKTVNVATLSDTVAEGSETFNLVLSSPWGGVIQQGSAMGTINNVAPSFLSATDATATEGGSLAFVISRSGNTTVTTTVQYTTAAGTATSGTDFTPASGSVSFAPGETTKTVNVATLTDTVVEQGDPEQLSFVLGNIINGTRFLNWRRDALGFIRDVPPNATTLSIADAQANEGAPLAFVITRSGDTTGTTSVTYGTTDGTAKWGVDHNYVQGSVSFAPGETSKTVSVETFIDAVAEGSETVSLALMWAQGAIILRPRGDGLILNVLPPAGALLSVAWAEAMEGAALAFVITRSGDTTGTTSVQYTTVAGTATSGTDFTSASGSVSFAPGETTKTVSVATVSDMVTEESETFNLVLSNPVDGIIAKGSAEGVINNVAISSLSVADAQASEGSQLAFVITRSGDTRGGTRVQYATAAGTATSGTDFTPASGRVNFAPGETTKTVNVATLSDTVAEGSETFNLVLSSPWGWGALTGQVSVVIAKGSAEGLIVNR